MTRINGFDLMAKEFAPIEYVVPGIIPEGLTVLAAAPKIGKSWLVLGLAADLSSGSPAFGGIPVDGTRPVLYYALEDGERRLKERLASIDFTPNRRVEFDTAIAEGGVLAGITQYVQEWAGHAPVVILDTLGKVMPPAGAQQQYGHDYRIMSQLKGTVDAVPGASLVIVHHTRKSGGEDFLDAVSGTQGIAGAADTVLVLKRERQEKRATLQVTSRDAAEGEYSLLIDDRGRWALDGQSLEEAADAARTARAVTGVGDRMADVIATVARFPEGIKPKDVKQLLPGVTGIDEYLRRAAEAGRIEKPSRGLYAPVSSVRSVSFPEPHSLGSHTTHTNNTPLEVDQ
jgi:hypothetical protein